VITSLRRRRLPASGRRNEDGAVAVEAALIFPILILLVFGMIEFSLLMRDYVTVNSIVRTGARTASAEPRVPTFAQDAADAIEKSGSAMPKRNIDFIYIYRANDKGFPGANGNTTMAGCPGSGCVRFTWDDTTGKFRSDFPDAGSWPATTINACQNDPGAMSVGVYMQATHPTLTGLFRSSFRVTDRAVMKFEPMSTTTPGVPCKP
jgi:TadE-like protein